MNKALIQKRKSEIERAHGPWTAHNIELTEGIYSIDGARPTLTQQVAYLVRIIQDFAHDSLSELRILDLACFEGGYAIEFARLGATVIGIEGRRSNIVKAHFSKECLGLENLTFIEDDVRNLSKDKYGMFDIIFCCGILYHLDTPELFSFVEKMYEVCSGFAIVNTHFASTVEGYSRNMVGGLEVRNYKAKSYIGRPFTEHPKNSTYEERQKNTWASLDNPCSFWLTKESLIVLLRAAGFASVYQCLNSWLTVDRGLFVATKS